MCFTELTQSKNQYILALTASLTLRQSKPCSCAHTATHGVTPLPAGPILSSSFNMVLTYSVNPHLLLSELLTPALTRFWCL